MKEKLLIEDAIFFKFDFDYPGYIPEIMKKYGIESDNQITEDAEFEIIQPKLLK